MLRKFPPLKKSWLAYLQLRSIRFVVLVVQCLISIVNGSSRMQPIVRFMYFLQLLHVIGMLIRRETTPKKGTNIAVRKTAIICLHATWATLLAGVVVVVVVVVVVAAVVVVVAEEAEVSSVVVVIVIVIIVIVVAVVVIVVKN